MLLVPLVKKYTKLVVYGLVSLYIKNLILEQYNIESIFFYSCVSDVGGGNNLTDLRNVG